MTHGDTGQAVFHEVLPKKEKKDWFVFLSQGGIEGTIFRVWNPDRLLSKRSVVITTGPWIASKTRMFIWKNITLSKLFLRNLQKSPFSRDFIPFFWKIFCKFSIRGYSMETIWEQFSDVCTPFLLTIKRYCLFLTCPHETNYPHSSLKTHETNY